MSTSTSLARDGIAPFIKSLVQMLDTLENNQLIRWGRLGESIVITNCAEFEVKLLPKYFKTGKFCSFIRQLNIYGFHKVDDEKTAQTDEQESSESQARIFEFANDNFRKHKPELMINIKRRKSVRRGLTVNNNSNPNQYRTTSLTMSNEDDDDDSGFSYPGVIASTPDPMGGGLPNASTSPIDVKLSNGEQFDPNNPMVQQLVFQYTKQQTDYNDLKYSHSQLQDSHSQLQYAFQNLQQSHQSLMERVLKLTKAILGGSNQGTPNGQPTTPQQQAYQQAQATASLNKTISDLLGGGGGQQLGAMAPPPAPQQQQQQQQYQFQPPQSPSMHQQPQQQSPQQSPQHQLVNNYQQQQQQSPQQPLQHQIQQILQSAQQQQQKPPQQQPIQQQQQPAQQKPMQYQQQPQQQQPFQGNNSLDNNNLLSLIQQLVSKPDMSGANASQSQVALLQSLLQQQQQQQQQPQMQQQMSLNQLQQQQQQQMSLNQQNNMISNLLYTQLNSQQQPMQQQQQQQQTNHLVSSTSSDTSDHQSPPVIDTQNNTSGQHLQQQQYFQQPLQQQMQQQQPLQQQQQQTFNTVKDEPIDLTDGAPAKDLQNSLLDINDFLNQRNKSMDNTDLSISSLLPPSTEYFTGNQSTDVSKINPMEFGMFY
ncbi:hypothetical protein SAMD00019534_022260 [Acytostelium subglobosum LB1]|uniref:hypothetical protein n=1 Tax=Acytostelium subglobosum LB1 TaxID=1410327 RepID=UPI000644BEAB|nr:hypothetical protein SAMD00019534_022260 [Acytostelium subglobosum LB1]GAM19051.1 hypothetical protein SAMD00019534_022260 [Acytostelium subglobosum LB1]|eukprot:XP_012756978.1 hypothetical protein SAMD00019534_022260 [Acytostelium subglobosum LB1]